MGLITKIFGTYSERQIRKLEPIADQIENLADEYAKLTDEELKAKTAEFKARFANGETLDDLLPEAFATIREADWRVLGKRPFHVQLLGGIVLHQGRIAEMKTGEGKTLVATLPAYLNALSGEGVHIVTVNEYLAGRDSEEMGRVFSFLGLTTGLILRQQSSRDKQIAYNADITYCTHSELGFDYLRDNMTARKQDMTQRGHIFCIIDEVDSILIDEARTPLIISGSAEEASDLYVKADRFVRSLSRFVIKEMDNKVDSDDVEQDYIVDEKAKTSVLTANGLKKAEKYFGVENISDPENADINRYITQALRAHGNMHRDQDYLVKDGEVLIIDPFTGRLMPGRRYNGGLHQAIEAKEGVVIAKENKTIATITYQNFFRLYKKLSGMTGTALTEESEFREIYSLDVVEIPTNKPMIRIDHSDSVFTTTAGKYAAILKQIKECNEKGQPILIGTIDIDKSEALSHLLSKNGIKHNVLNAKQHAREAEIVAQAGRPYAVTISTNMAGRGTDILLGGNPEFMAKNEMRKRGVDEHLIQEATGTVDTNDAEILSTRDEYKKLYQSFKESIAPDVKKVCDAGGLFILGTERHESRRIDNQLRGRSGRQGDPGESHFYISLEDDLMRLFGSDRLLGLSITKKMDPNTPLDFKMVGGMIENAQRQKENSNFQRRKHVLSYDEVMNQQRDLIYSERMQVLDGGDIRPLLEKMIRDYFEITVPTFLPEENPLEWNFTPLFEKFRGILNLQKVLDFDEEELKTATLSEIVDRVTEHALFVYHNKDVILNPEIMREIERAILLRRIDVNWMNHIDAMEDLKETVGLSSYAQRDPLTEYKICASEMFEDMTNTIREQTVLMLLGIRPESKIERKAVGRNMQAGVRPGAPQRAQRTQAKPVPIKAGPKISPNDPCPCGSGKKYKKCCGLG